jgi:hypothetical protein
MNVGFLLSQMKNKTSKGNWYTEDLYLPIPVGHLHLSTNKPTVWYMSREMPVFKILNPYIEQWCGCMQYIIVDVWEL